MLPLGLLSQGANLLYLNSAKQWPPKPALPEALASSEDLSSSSSLLELPKVASAAAAVAHAEVAVDEDLIERMQNAQAAARPLVGIWDLKALHEGDALKGLAAVLTTTTEVEPIAISTASLLSFPVMIIRRVRLPFLRLLLAQPEVRVELLAAMAEREALTVASQALGALLKYLSDEIAQAALRVQVAREVARRAQALVAMGADAASSECASRARDFILEARDLIPLVRLSFCSQVCALPLLSLSRLPPSFSGSLRCIRARATITSRESSWVLEWPLYALKSQRKRSAVKPCSLAIRKQPPSCLLWFK